MYESVLYYTITLVMSRFANSFAALDDDFEPEDNSGFVTVPTKQHKKKKIIEKKNSEKKINPNPKGIKSSTVTLCYKDSVLVCVRGCDDWFYNKIFSCGGKLDKNESPEDAAVRETREEAGVTIKKEDLVYFNTINGRNNYIVYLSEEPEIKGPGNEFSYEALNVQDILGVKTTNRWAFVPVDKLKKHFMDKENWSPFSQIFNEMYIKKIFSKN
jgi:8-oxo-dGTP pyrophosphatase MutT (NUDIX family)